LFNFYKISAGSDHSSANPWQKKKSSEGANFTVLISSDRLTKD